MSPDEWLYEYAIVRYVPFPERGECINIGLVMLNKRKKWLKGKVRIDRNKVLSLNPKANLEVLQAQAELFEKTDIPKKDMPIEERYRWLTAEKSAVLRVSSSHPGIIVEIPTEASSDEVLDKEFSRLFSLLVE